MQTFLTFFDQTFLGISLGQFAAAFGVLILAMICKKVLAHMFTRLLHPLTDKTANDYDDQFVRGLKKPLELLILTAGTDQPQAVVGLCHQGPGHVLRRLGTVQHDRPARYLARSLGG